MMPILISFWEPFCQLVAIGPPNLLEVFLGMVVVMATRLLLMGLVYVHVI